MKDRGRQTGQLWISGVNPVREVLCSKRPGVQEIVLVRSDFRGKSIVEEAERQHIPVRFETRDRLAALVGHTQHQGVALRIGGELYTPWESFLSRSPEELDPLMILDCVQDPQNLGALLRSACFLGAKGILIPKDRAAALTDTVIRVAAGAVAYLPVMQVVNLARALEQIKEAGLWILGLDVSAAQSLYETDLSIPVGIIVGNEQKGLRSLIRKQCDLLVRIPAHGPLQSLNAATAGALALAEVQRRRPQRKA